MFIFSNEKGMAMPTVLIFLVVVTLLSVALWHYANSEVSISVREEHKARAYYLARAGAESMGRHILINPDVISAIPEVDDTITSDQIDYEVDYSGAPVHVGELEVVLKRIDEDRVRITGTGTVEGIVQSVSLILETQEPFDGVVYSMGSLVFQNQVTVNGDLVSGGTITPPIRHTGSVKENTIITFPPPDPDFPPVPTYSGNLSVGRNITVTISSSPAGAYQTIFIGNRGSLVITAASGDIYVETKNLDMHNQATKLELVTSADHDIVIVVDEMIMKKIKVSGNGNAYIYVRSRLNVQTPHADVDSNALLIVYLGPGCIMELQANSHFEGLVYGPQATVEVGGNADLQGAMIVEQLKGRGGSFTIGSAGTEIIQKYNWSVLDLDYGGYWMVQWEQD